MGWMVTQWQLAKRTFEATTNKKKPGKKFLGFYTRPSGIEPALEKIEKVGPFDFKNRGPALEELKKKVAAYLQILEKAVNEEKAENADAAVKSNMALGLDALKKDVHAILAKAEADYAKDLAEHSGQVGTVQVSEKAQKQIDKDLKGGGRGMVNFGPDAKVREDLIAAVRKADAAMARFATQKSPRAFNEGGASSAVIVMKNEMAKWDNEFTGEIRTLSPFVRKMPENYDATSVDLFADQVNIIIRRIKAKLGI